MATDVSEKPKLSRKPKARKNNTGKLTTSRAKIDKNNNKVAQPTAPNEITTKKNPDKPRSQPPDGREQAIVLADKQAGVLTLNFAGVVTPHYMSKLMQDYQDKTGYTLREIGRKVGINHTQVSCIIDGKAKVDYSMKALQKLGFRFNLTIEIPEL